MKPTRLLSLLLLLALLLTLAPAPRAAAETLSGAWGKVGDNLTWSFADGVLTLEGSGAMADYASADNVPWAAFRETITAVSLPEGLTSIGDYAFSYCPLVEVSLPGSLRELGSNPFVDRGTLKGITLSPDNEAFTLLDGALITADGKTLLCYPSGLEVESFAVPEGRGGDRGDRLCPL